ncbi:GD24351 [Drosophila simulans]|uniref:GD24351 n=1 Tax=Drosophila simulans TaxID=7240 RepID=B4Q4W6_DROSI|nr:GD24351 [Drosophila simulans]
MTPELPNLLNNLSEAGSNFDKDYWKRRAPSGPQAVRDERCKGRVILGVEEKILACLKGSVETVVSKGRPRPSVPSPVDDTPCLKPVPAGRRTFGREHKNLACSEGSVESVVGTSSPRSTVASPVDDTPCPITF